jgi:hypothetical protein
LSSFEGQEAAWNSVGSITLVIYRARARFTLVLNWTVTLEVMTVCTTASDISSVNLTEGCLFHLITSSWLGVAATEHNTTRHMDYASIAKHIKMPPSHRFKINISNVSYINLQHRQSDRSYHAIHIVYWATYIVTELG